ncbi:MAG: hypothetical protein PHU36_01155 [Syntrophomonadaceae bacterium]|nr:hypothetical protein [Syntrophomonadaceae bacterium]
MYKGKYKDIQRRVKMPNNIVDILQQQQGLTDEKANEMKTGLLSEDDVKGILEKHLVSQGWATKIAWGKETGIDIHAKRDETYWIIEVKGTGSSAEMTKYFQVSLAQTLQAMNDPEAKYSIALPDIDFYRTKWMKLPSLAKEKLKVSVLFISANFKVREVFI